MNTILILSTGRVGSKALVQLFSEYFSNVETHHGGPYSRIFNVLGNMCLANLIPSRMVGKLYSRVVGRAVHRCRAEFYLDANAYLVGLLPYLSETYPNLKVVHLVRDPRDVVRSYINWIHMRPKSRFAHDLIPFWQPKPRLTTIKSEKGFGSEKLFDQLAWVWNIKNSEFMKLSRSEVPYRLVRFEDLFAAPKDNIEFAGLLEFLKLTSTDVSSITLNKKVNITTKKSFPHWTKWSSELCSHIDKRCGSLMRSLGYGNESIWQLKLKDLKRPTA